jgi:predicted site-specific integrase-resolvase
MDSQQEHGDLLTPGEVAALFGVSVLTVARWRKAGRIVAQCWTPGHGQPRYSAAYIDSILISDKGAAGD